MLLIICTKSGKNPSWTVDATERTRDAGWTDGRTDRRTDGRSETNIGGYNNGDGYDDKYVIDGKSIDDDDDDHHHHHHHDHDDGDAADDDHEDDDDDKNDNNNNNYIDG